MGELYFQLFCSQLNNYIDGSANFSRSTFLVSACTLRDSAEGFRAQILGLPILRNKHVYKKISKNSFNMININ